MERIKKNIAFGICSMLLLVSQNIWAQQNYYVLAYGHEITENKNTPVPESAVIMGNIFRLEDCNKVNQAFSNIESSGFLKAVKKNMMETYKKERSISRAPWTLNASSIKIEMSADLEDLSKKYWQLIEKYETQTGKKFRTVDGMKVKCSDF